MCVVCLVQQVLGGRLAEKYGAKWVFGVSILSGGIGNILAPTAARLHYGVFIALRALQGFFQVGYNIIIHIQVQYRYMLVPIHM